MPNSKAAQSGNPHDDRISDESVEILNGIKRISQADIAFLKMVSYDKEQQQLVITEGSGQKRELNTEEIRRFIRIIAGIIIILY